MSRVAAGGRPKPRRVVVRSDVAKSRRLYARPLILVAVAVIVLAVVGGVVAVVGFAGSGSPGRQGSADPIYAIVGGRQVTRHWYRSVLRVERLELVAEIQNARQTGNEGVLVSQLRQQEKILPKTVLNNMIGNIVIEQRGQIVGAKTSTYDEFTFLNEFTQQRFGGQVSNLIKAARLRGLSFNQYRQFLLMLDYNFQALGAALAAHLPKTGVEVHVRGVVIPLSEPARSRYATELAFRGARRQYQSRLAAIRTDAVAAERLVRAGRTWGQVTASDFPASARFRDLGWRWIKSLPAPVRAAVASSRAIRTAVVVSPFGVEVLQVLGHRVVRLSPTQREAEQGSAIRLWLRKQEARSGYVVRYLSPR